VTTTTGKSKDIIVGHVAKDCSRKQEELHITIDTIRTKNNVGHDVRYSGGNIATNSRREVLDSVDDGMTEDLLQQLTVPLNTRSLWSNSTSSG
jgi:hypothetical protein